MRWSQSPQLRNVSVKYDIPPCLGCKSEDCSHVSSHPRPSGRGNGLNDALRHPAFCGFPVARDPWPVPEGEEMAAGVRAPTLESYRLAGPPRDSSTSIAEDHDQSSRSAIGCRASEPFVYEGSSLTSRPSQPGRSNDWSGRSSSISASTRPSLRPSKTSTTQVSPP